MKHQTSDGTLLNVEKMGEGPILILVPGANGTGNVFLGVVMILKEKNHSYYLRPTWIWWHVFGKTAAAEFDNRYRLLTDAEDVLELANAFSPNQPVYLFGTSSGSIVAAQAFSLNPGRFVKVAIHESPIMTLTDEYVKSYRNQVKLVSDALSGNFAAITGLFADMHVAPLDAKMMGIDPNITPDPVRMKSMLFWLKFEVLQYTGQTIDWKVFADNQEKVVLLNGTDSIGFLPQEINRAIGEKINVPITMIPGAHLGYAQKPVEFAQALKTALGL